MISDDVVDILVPLLGIGLLFSSFFFVCKACSEADAEEMKAQHCHPSGQTRYGVPYCTAICTPVGGNNSVCTPVCYPPPIETLYYCDDKERWR